jgi:hypothetical protein
MAEKKTIKDRGVKNELYLKLLVSFSSFLKQIYF